MSMTFEKYFEEKVSAIEQQYTGKTLVVFKGFDMPQVKYIKSRENCLLHDTDIFPGGILDISLLSDAWLDIMTEIKMAAQPILAIYEELLAIRDFLPKLGSVKIVVVDNNVLSPWVPSLFAYDQVLKLFDYLQEEREAKEADLQWMAQAYGDVKLLGDGKALLHPTVMDDVETIPFWSGEYELNEVDDDTNIIEVGSLKDWEYCLDILSGNETPAVFIQKGDALAARQRALAIAVTELGLQVAFDESDLYREPTKYNPKQFEPLLKKYWGDKASFRPLLFYSDPDRSSETETISQGEIIAEIVDQCEMAHDGEKYSNVFITAPTGSGKSILFQIPALYLAEKYKLVTLVVSPLIALMNDQVDQLQRERGISCVACINSSMTMEERSAAYEAIQRGDKSLIYLAPELLLTTHLQSFLGGREIGMIVIDEAHTVTSWGRDFRSDYWFLGDFLKKAKREGLNFPVLCLTATAVYSGDNDVVNDTIQELGLEKTILHLGNVRRDNIDFDIVHHEKSEVHGKIETAKMEITLDRVREYVDRGEKVLTYFPYRSQVDGIYSNIEPTEHIKLRRYHGQIPTAERKMVEKSYKSGEAMGLFCTKAFGMGIDVGDIMHVVHFAPTGTLADYVQEIGRAARNPDIQGYAHIDYFPSDLRYVRTLNGISEMRQYQLREMLKKICAIYNAKKRRNLLISSETFEYLFKEDEAENRTKSGLMLLAKDLNYKSSFPVLIVRPKAMLSKNYVNVPQEIENQVLSKYGQYMKEQKGAMKRTIISTRQSASDITVYNTGKTYLVDMEAIWENCYPDKAFGMFKKEFFEERFSAAGSEFHVSPRSRVEIRYADEFNVINQRLEQIISAVSEIFGNYKNAEQKQFTALQFEKDLEAALGEKVIAHDKVAMLLDIFTEHTDEGASFSATKSMIRVLRKRKQVGADEVVYFVSSPNYARIPNFFVKQLNQCVPNTENNSFFSFYPITKTNSIEIMPLLRVLELVNLASYETRGGEKSEVFIRINDPDRLNRLASTGKYTNSVLQTIQEKHRSNVKLLSAFFSMKMTSEERWELIEQYFLGNQSYVEDRLHLQLES